MADWISKRAPESDDTSFNPRRISKQELRFCWSGVGLRGMAGRRWGQGLSLAHHFLFPEMSHCITPRAVYVISTPSPFFPLPFISANAMDGMFACIQTLQLCLTPGNPMDCSPPGFSVHGILQARMLEWVAPPPGDLSELGIESISLEFSALADRFFTISTTWEAQWNVCIPPNSYVKSSSPVWWCLEVGCLAGD